MSIDMSQFYQTFLEEAKEHAIDLERGLLELDGTADPDLNAIFRAAHSIKGGAGTFGFEDIAAFTHVVESVLQRCRDGEIQPDEPMVNCLLRSVDIINDLIHASENNETADTPEKDSCLSELSRYLETQATATIEAEAESEQAGKDEQPTEETSTASAPETQTETEVHQPPESDTQIIEIIFEPFAHMPRTGSDPMNIFRELATLGELKVIADVKDVPPLEKLEPEDMSLKWVLELVTSASPEEIQDVFLFVEDDAKIELNTIGAFNLPAPPPAAETQEAAESAKPEQGSPTVEESTSTHKAEKPPVSTQTAPAGASQPRKEPRKAASSKSDNKETSFIRVAVDKVDSLINLVGELVTTHAMVEQRSAHLSEEEHQKLRHAVVEMAGHTRALQEGIMAIRMMPIDFAFSRFPRMVRDISSKLGKEVRLVTEGGNTELDKTVIERMTDPLTHLVRNSIDHGLEQPNERVETGKKSEGTITLRSFYRGGNVVIEVEDDGKGMSREKILAKAIEKGLTTADEQLSDEEVFQFIFNSGFSTAAQVTDVSGRGVGMDVVSKNIKSLGGSIHISSREGQGTLISINLPLTLAILDGMAIKCGAETYIIPLLNIIESIRPSRSDIRSMQDDVEVINIRGNYLPILRLHKALNVPNSTAEKNIENGIAVIVESGQNRIALFVDDLLGERQVVIKSIEHNYKTVEGLSGATILGDGQVAFILDLSGLIRMSGREGSYNKVEEVTPAPTLSIEDKIAQQIEEIIQRKAAFSQQEQKSASNTQEPTEKMLEETLEDTNKQHEPTATIH